MHSLRFVQFLPVSPEECWDFFASPNNLKLITPNHLGFDLQKSELSPMYAGQIILHKIRPVCNIPMEWVTEITHVDKPAYFIDEQRLGPYKFWHHEHRFIKRPDGTQMIDTIHYKLHWGILGRMLNSIKIKHSVEEIFSYRKQKLSDIFNGALLS